MVHPSHAAIGRNGRAEIFGVHGMGGTVPDSAVGLGFQIII